MNIDLHIERLVLDDLIIARHQTPQIRAAIEAELTRLLGEHGLAANLQSGGAMPSVSADDIRLTSASNPGQIGQQIAQSVYGGIGSKR